MATRSGPHALSREEPQSVVVRRPSHRKPFPLDVRKGVLHAVNDLTEIWCHFRCGASDHSSLDWCVGTSVGVRWSASVRE
jgi:hypothetical protein